MHREYVIVAAIVISLQLYIFYSAVHKQCVTEDTSNNKAGTLPQVNTNYHRGKVNSKVIRGLLNALTPVIVCKFMVSY